MATPSVIRLPVRSAFLWDTFRAELEARLAEAGDSRPLPDSEVLVAALDSGLLLISRGVAAEIHATKNSDVVSWLEMEVVHPPPPASLGVKIAEAQEQLDKLKANYDAWAGHVVIDQDSVVDSEKLMNAKSATLVNSGRILTGEEAEAAKMSGAARTPIRHGPDNDPPPAKPKMRG